MVESAEQYEEGKSPAPGDEEAEISEVYTDNVAN